MMLLDVSGCCALAAATAPTFSGALLRILTLQDYNTRVVTLGVALLGAVSGLIGAFMLLHKRALLGDALSHATLPGIGVAFLVMSALGGSGKWLPGLLAGAAVFGALGALSVVAITRLTRIKQDAALGIVLAVYFGLGVVILTWIQNLRSSSAAGLNTFIYGKTAAMLLSDAVMIACLTVVVGLACVMLRKEWGLLCFDPQYAATQGWPTLLLDVLMMAAVVGVTVVGLQAVGLILMIALLIIPAAAARFWTHRLDRMLWLAALLGALSGYVGAGLSALLPRLPAGALIVLTAGLAFGVSMLAGSARGMLRREWNLWQLRRRTQWQHLLRACYELHEALLQEGQAPVIRESALRAQRSWSQADVQRLLKRALQRGVLARAAGGWRLTADGLAESRRVARNHRLWELYLITHADVAASHVDRDADEVEHILGPALLDELEASLRRTYPDLADPPSPHATAASGVRGA